jgi:ferredoxin-NADP reductase
MESDCTAEIFEWQPFSEDLVIFRLKSLSTPGFPEYEAGQNIELRHGEASMVFSIASAPYQTKQAGFLEFFTKMENSLRPGAILTHAHRAGGDFTLRRAGGFENVILIATGTGVAPFISMLREVQHCGATGVRYTLVHGSRKFKELGYYKELSALASAPKLDFVYVPTISRPTNSDWELTSLGKGRAGTLLRRMLHLPHDEEAVLPSFVKIKDFHDRFSRQSTIMLACGSHAAVEDIREIALESKIRFEKEDW